MSAGKWLAAVGVGAAVAIPAAPWATGQLVHKRMTMELADIQALLPFVKVVSDTTEGGVFSSTRRTTLEVTNIFDNCPSAMERAVAEAMGTPLPKADKNKAFQFTLVQSIQHGPFPALQHAAAAKATYTIEVDGKPLSAQLAKGLKSPLETRGEMPSLYGLYGFNGSVRGVLASAAGGVTLKEEGKTVSLDWDAISIDSTTGKNYSYSKGTGEVPKITARFTDTDGKIADLSIEQLAITQDFKSGIPGNLLAMLGTQTVAVKRVTFKGSEGENVLIEGIKLPGETTMKDGFLDMRNGFSVERINAKGESVGPVKYDLTYGHLDAKALKDLYLGLIKAFGSGCEAREQTMESAMKEPFRAILKASPTVTLHELSVSYKGNKAKLTADATAGSVSAEDLVRPDAIMQKLKVNAELTVAEAMLRDLSVLMSKAEDGVTPEQLAMVIEGQLAQAAEQELITRNNGTLKSKVAFANGALTINGKIKDLGAMFGGGNHPANEEELGAEMEGGEMEADPMPEADAKAVGE